jgi:hypothetical protein
MSTCKTGGTSRQLDEELDESFPASDPATLTEPAGDARDAADRGCCGPAADRDEPETETKGCCCEQG